MKAWSRAQHAQEREAGLYAHHQAEAELISSYLNSHQAVEAAVAAVSSSSQQQPYGVPIPPPLVPNEQGYPEDHHPLPPTRSTSSGGGGQRSRGKRSRHAGTSSQGRSTSAVPSGDIHYPKYDLYGHTYKYNTGDRGQDQCQYTTKYGEDCHFGNVGSKCAYNKTWPKQHCTDEEGRVYTQDDQQVQYTDLQLESMHSGHHQQHPQQQQQSRPKKKKHHNRDKSPQQLESYPCFSSRDREYLVSTGNTSRNYLHETQSKAAHDPIPAIEEVGRYIEQAENRAKSVKDIARDLAKDRAALAAAASGQQTEQSEPGLQEGHQQKPELEAAEYIPPPPEHQTPASSQVPSQPRVDPGPKMESAQPTHALQTFNPQGSTKAEVQLQQEHIQYVDNECCQVAVGVVSQNQSGDPQVQHPQASASTSATPPRSRQPPTASAGLKQKSGTMNAAQMSAASQFATLERNMAEVAERNRQSRAELQNQTLDRRSRYGDSCDTCDAPLTPASLAGIDHRDLEHRPLTRSVTRATVYDEPPEK